MASEIRANKQTNRAGLGTVTYTDTGIIVSGIVTANSFSGTLNTTSIDLNGDLDVDGHTNLDNVSIAGFTTFSQNINVLGSMTGQSVVLNAGSPTIFLNDTDTDSDFSIQCNGGLLKFMDTTNSYAVRLAINSSGNVEVKYDLDVDGHTNLDNVSVAGVSTFTGQLNAGAVSVNSTINVIGESTFRDRIQLVDSAPEILLSKPGGGLDSRILNDGSGNLIIGHGIDSDTPTERLRITSNGQVSISNDGTTDGLLTIKGDSDQVGTPSIRLLDGSDTREVSISNTSGDFVASVHGNDNAIHGHIKMFESGIIDFNNGGASGSNVNRLRIHNDGRVLMDNTDGTFTIGGDNVYDSAKINLMVGNSSQTSATTEATAIVIHDQNSRRGGTEGAGSWKSKIAFRSTQINGNNQSEGASIVHDITYNNYSSTKMRSDLVFKTRGDAQTAASDAATEKLRIRHDGKVIIGTNYTGGTLSVTGNLITDDGTNGRITLQADGTNTNQILSTTTGFGSYCNMSYQAADHIFRYGGTETFRINADGTFRGKPDQVNGRDTNEVLGGKSFKYTTSNISPSWGSGSNGWYSFYQMYDGVYTFWLHTAAHSSICFTVSKGYTGSQKSYITVHHFINNANGNYGNVKGIRVTNSGVIQVYIHASASNQYFEMYVQAVGGDLTNMTNFYATLTKDTSSPSINDSWGTSDAYSPAQGAHTTDGVCSPRILHNRQEMSCFATSTSLYGSNTSGAKGFYWDPGTASVQSAQPRNTGWSAYYINKHDGNGGSENRYIDFWHNGGQVGNITLSGSGVNYGSSSDYRLKKDDVVMTDGISRVKQLRPIKYKWIKDNVDDEGFFAHEAQAVVPVAVEGTKDQVVLQSEVDAGTQPEDKSAGEPIYQTMDNSKLVPVLTAALKEAIDKIETLEAKVAALESS